MGPEVRADELFAEYRAALCGGMKEIMKDRKLVDVIIPTYKTDGKFEQLLAMLKRQTYPVHKIIIMNTEQGYWKKEYEEDERLEVHHLTKAEFDHGKTRGQAVDYSEADIIVFMTDDSVPEDERLIEQLAAGFELADNVAEVYARQLPTEDCRVIERYTRSFNYPDENQVKTLKDLDRLGIKTYFASNVCCAYDRKIYKKLGGFITKTIFNEDMIFAAGAIQAGYAVVYAAGARVVHSHNLSGREQFKRNFDLAVSQADHPEIFEGIKSESEGMRLVKNTASYLKKSGNGRFIPLLIWQSGCKYLGYRMGKRYKKLPGWVVRRCTMNGSYWTKAGD